ncbi:MULTISPECIES: anti-sigma factor [unclassified Brevibacterium]|uniref:anti-sigma factor n=1 Tax=unclassified Brevibacterium TaxID=2614124 RepID=UPI0010F6CA8F|nr:MULTISPECIES: anti-sigma factor [unclassified Brevibacterium]MCM1010965.1 anti-sigma factor [Brevibacterium sp. XM4083]
MNADRDYLAAGLALGGLSDDELVEAQALADTDPEFQAEVAAYGETAAFMAASDAPAAVSEETKNAILSLPDHLAQESATSDTAAAARPDSDAAGTDAAPRDGHILAEAGDRPADTGATEVGDRTAAAESDSSRSAQTDEAASGADEPIDLAARRRKRNWLPWAAAAAALIVVCGFGISAWQMQQRQNELEATLAETQQRLDETARLMDAPDLRTTTADLAAGGSVTVVSSETEQLIHVTSRDVTPAEGTSLQMWVIGDDGPKSVGLMVGDAENIDGSDFAAGNLFGITVEPEGGSPQPTTDPVVAVEL